ncbi:hypothetical protein RUND412_003584 [Rhizina undulata]
MSFRPSFQDQVFLKHFTQKSQDERQAFLSQLASQFRQSDWFHINRLLDIHSYYRDIVGTLPLEIALLILENVHPVEICRFRLVSRRWNELLSSKEVCRAIAVKWYKREVLKTLSAREGGQHIEVKGEAVEVGKTAEGIPWKIIMENIASRKIRFCLGPNNGPKILSYNRSTLHVMEHESGRLATTCDGFVHVYDLTAHGGVLRAIATPDRSSIMKLALASSFVAIATNGGKCYVRQLSSHAAQHDFRFPSANLQELIADENLLVGLFENCFVVHDVKSKLTRGLAGDNEEYNRFFTRRSYAARFFLKAMLDGVNGNLSLLRLPVPSEKDCIGVLSTFSTHTGELLNSRILNYDSPRPGPSMVSPKLLSPDGYAGNGIYTLLADVAFEADKVIIRRKFWDKENDEVGEDEWLIDQSADDIFSKGSDWKVMFWDDKCCIIVSCPYRSGTSISFFSPNAAGMWPGRRVGKLEKAFSLTNMEVIGVNDRFFIFTNVSGSMSYAGFQGIHEEKEMERWLL